VSEVEKAGQEGGEAAQRKRMKIAAVIARLGAAGISRDDPKDYFWEEFAEELRDDPNTSEVVDGSERKPGR
jgi:hypothetical protein